MPDPGMDVLIGAGGVIMGSLTTWAAVARGYGALQERVKGLESRFDRGEKAVTERIDRHEETVTKALDGLVKKMDRVLDVAGAGRSGSRAFPHAGE